MAETIDAGQPPRSRQVYIEPAQVYDLIHSEKDYAAESAEVDRLIKERNRGAATLLDVGCGTGGHVRYLKETYRAVGVDADRHMVEAARKALPDVEFHEADMRSLNLGRRYDAVACLFSAIGYMRSVAELNGAISAMAHHLSPGGVLIVDGWIDPGCWTDRPAVRLHTAESEALAVALMIRSDRVDQMTILDMHYMVGTPAGCDHFERRVELRLFAQREYEEAFGAAGLSVETIPSPMAGRHRFIALCSSGSA